MELSKAISGLDFESVKAKLTGEDYGLIVSESVRHPSLYIVKYHMFKSNFGSQVVKDCRGIILEKGSNRIICWPFSKFWNVGEMYADEIDWGTATVQEKYDGSLMKVYNYEGQWIIATNNVIDARDAPSAMESKSFHDVFLDCWRTQAEADELPFHELNPDHAYMLEAMHPSTQIVVKHSVPTLRHLSTRCMKTFTELTTPSFPGVEKARVFPLSTLDHCLAYMATQDDPFVFEGCVIVDAAFRRVKLKSVAYVAAHHLASKNVLPDAKRMMVVLAGETEEVAMYLKEEEEALMDLKKLFHLVIEDTARTILAIREQLDGLLCTEKERKKILAMTAKTARHPFQFKVLMKLEKIGKITGNPNEAPSEAIRNLLVQEYSASLAMALILVAELRAIGALVNSAS